MDYLLEEPSVGALVMVLIGLIQVVMVAIITIATKDAARFILEDHVISKFAFSTKRLVYSHPKYL